LNNNLQRRRYINQNKIPKKKLKEVQRNDIEDEENYMNDKNCIICYEEINDESFITDLPECHHMYHYKCISEWFKRESKCPLCKIDYYGRFDDVPNNQEEDAQPLIQ
jgi:hypothetical protein